MKKKIVLIGGSPREGANSDQVIREAEQVITDAGGEAEIFTIREKKFGYCMACDSCKNGKAECVQKDDASYIIEKLKHCDGILLASPVYFGHIPGTVKTLIDRFYVLFQPKLGPQYDEKETKRLGIVFSFGGGPYEEYAKVAEEVAEFFKVTGVNEHQVVLCGGNNEKTSYLKNQEYRENVKQVTKWLVK